MTISKKRTLQFGHIIALAVILIIGAILYYVALFGPFGGWIYEYIASPVLEFIFPGNLNILEELLLMVTGMAMLYTLFFIPYIIFSGIVFVAVLFRFNS